MGRAMRKRDWDYMQADLGFRCPQVESLAAIECFNGEPMPGWDFAHVQDDANPHIVHMLEGTFSLDEAHTQKIYVSGSTL